MVYGCAATRPIFSFSEAVEIVQTVRPRLTYLVHLSHETGHAEAERLVGAGIEIAWDGLVARPATVNSSSGPSHRATVCPPDSDARRSGAGRPNYGHPAIQPLL